MRLKIPRRFRKTYAWP